MKTREEISDDVVLNIGKQKVAVTNLNKIFWPATAGSPEGYTKGDLISYYREISPIILPYLKDRPESLLRYPDGINGLNFYHKDVEIAPKWVDSINIKSESDGKNVHYVICQNEATLVYLINLGCIDLNPWNSRVDHLNNPDYMIIDLDPEEIGFQKVVETALVVHEVMEMVGIPNFPKTSGASGMHIYTPLGAKYTYEQVRDFAQIIAVKVNEILPKITSLERSPEDRKGKVYLDCFQNARGQTLAAPYSVRAKPGATVSTPLEWKEVNEKLTPQMFTMKNIMERISKVGDLYSPVLGKGFDMKKSLRKLSL
ncbi:MAG: ligase D protein [Candidatus Collierbacteria bacterium GW2011_GWB1_44_6]|uniref:Ligase D protein n=2 Tax=Candidatus Collieribacteriota TaxID=1752725 RepID=A0A0G1JM63_9BACT|nr:MAG: ligase D protein [Candidatus Collierbacteria bacterium GW2011_GWC2_43_12]KKT72478.1 MAG: ligase D protein [Candidatus Collierbacteria bacterium GW2011_GWB1_44_6]KKT81224.1 MAG: ligase D protein [Microgenomates group bacterium GW2011_GWC1_44_9]